MANNSGLARLHGGAYKYSHADQGIYFRHAYVLIFLMLEEDMPIQDCDTGFRVILKKKEKREH